MRHLRARPWAGPCSGLTGLGLTGQPLACTAGTAPALLSRAVARTRRVRTPIVSDARARLALCGASVGLRRGEASGGRVGSDPPGAVRCLLGRTSVGSTGVRGCVKTGDGIGGVSIVCSVLLKSELTGSLADVVVTPMKRV